jgi:aminobenzoyl-glutamate utilization protein B
MKGRNTILIVPIFAMLSSGWLTGQDSKSRVVDHLDSRGSTYAGVALQIWGYAEVGYQEERSSALLQETLQDAGFAVEAGVAGIPTAFVASFGTGEPVIGILAEFDALPGISQDSVPFRKPLVEGGGSGHACGHHLFGTGSVAAAVAVKDWLTATGSEGVIRLYGTPAEEGGAGKVYMVREGLFDDVDVVLHWHAGDRNDASAGTSLANRSAKFRFHGRSTHAAGSPERGRSALDAVEAMNHMVNLMREHVPMQTRIHYVITRGGFAPNVVPDYAEVFYYVRYPDARDLEGIWDRVVKAAEGAALGTGTDMEYEVIHGIHSLLPNESLARVMHVNLTQVGGVTYTDEERSVAERIHATLETHRELGSEATVEPLTMRPPGGSTDVGDVSWMVPTAGLRTATWVPGTPAHSWQAVAAGGMSIGAKGMMVAAKTLALTAIDLYTNPAYIEEARAEFERRRGPDFVYWSLLGDRDPPLDYRR